MKALFVLLIAVSWTVVSLESIELEFELEQEISSGEDVPLLYLGKSTLSRQMNGDSTVRDVITAKSKDVTRWPHHK